jgi:putative inorganic carbon (HCO3(-)) transporter
VTAARRLGLGVAIVPLAAIIAIALVHAAGASTAVDGFERASGLIAIAGVGIAAIAAPPAWTLSGALALTMFQSHWDELGSSVSVDRYAMLLAIAAVLAREIRHRDGRLRTRPIDWLLILVSLYAAMSLALTDPSDTDARFELLDRLGVIPFLLFFVAPFAYRTAADRRVLLGTLVAMGTYLGVTAILETVNANPVIVPHYITDPNLGIHTDRARGPFLDAGANGIVMYACAIAAAIAYTKWQDPRWRRFALFVAALGLLGVLLSLTRAVWLAAAIATPLTLLAARETRRFVVPVMAGATVIMIVAIATVPGLAERVDRRRKDTTETFWSRKNSNAAAIRMVADRPLLGFGWGQFGETSVPYYRQSQDYPMTFLQNLHNVYLQNAVELGLVGALLWFAAVLAAVGGAILRRGPPELRPWKLGLLALALAQLTAWATVPAEYILPTLLLWAWAGVAWGPDVGRGPWAQPEPAAR